MQCQCGKNMERINISRNIYYKCNHCQYLKKDKILSLESQKNRYDQHICDEAYLLYMEDTYKRIKPYLTEGVSLDFGCGKIHALSDILNSKGYPTNYYDLFYYPDFHAKKYQNIIMIEVLEHLEEPLKELKKLFNNLVIGGRIIIHTKPIPQTIENWWYLRDTTHVSFIKKETLLIWGQILGFNLIEANGDIFVLERIR